ncbi:MAG: DUF4258 domain-containing protein [Anaerolineae bacterium]|nr:DUF4258 domain-containing protein [Anaerolineae bacterium]
MKKDNDYLFEVMTPLGFSVHMTHSYWKLITTIKHPIMAGKETDVIETLENPDQIRASKSDPNVYLFYREKGTSKWTCVVTKDAKGAGFVITTYPTDAIKEGEEIWRK